MHTFDSTAKNGSWEYSQQRFRSLKGKNDLEVLRIGDVIQVKETKCTKGAPLEAAGKGNLSFISLFKEMKLQEEELLLFLSSLTLSRLIGAITENIKKKYYEDKI